MTNDEIKKLTTGSKVRVYSEDRNGACKSTIYILSRVQQHTTRAESPAGAGHAWIDAEGVDDSGATKHLVIESDEYIEAMGMATHRDVTAMGAKATLRVLGAVAMLGADVEAGEFNIEGSITCYFGVDDDARTVIDANRKKAEPIVTDVIVPGGYMRVAKVGLNDIILDEHTTPKDRARAGLKPEPRDAEGPAYVSTEEAARYGREACARSRRSSNWMTQAQHVDEMAAHAHEAAVRRGEQRLTAHAESVCGGEYRQRVDEIVAEAIDKGLVAMLHAALDNVVEQEQRSWRLAKAYSMSAERFRGLVMGDFHAIEEPKDED